ncbi:MAG: hypothetical protein AAF721_39705, partial [Myxococcota bacterium]
MRRQERRDNARREARRAVTAAQRAEVRHRSRSNEPDPDARHPFACAFACAECLRLRMPPRPSADRDPMRSPPQEDMRPTDACECGERAWVDLSVRDHAAALREPDDENTSRQRSRTRRLIRLMVVLGLWVSVAPWRVVDNLIQNPTAITGHLLLSAALTVVLGYGVAGLVRAWRAWRKPSTFLLGRRASYGRHVESAPIDGPDALRSPLTHRACVAYQVTVTHGDASKPALYERRCSTARVGDAAVHEDTGVELYGHRRSHVPIDTKDPRMMQWLRERGLDPQRGPWLGTESVLSAGDSAR